MAQRQFAFFLNKNINSLILLEMDEKKLHFYDCYVEKRKNEILFD